MTVSCGSQQTSMRGSARRASARYTARSSFSSSASRNASTPCNCSGIHTRNPRQSRDSSAEYSL